MSAQPRWRLLGALSVATAAALAAGLVSTPAAANVPPEGTQAAVNISTPRTAGAFSVYVPRVGDTLWRISARFCGRGSLYPRLAAASGIVNPDRIIAGRTRVMLACSSTATTKPPISHQSTYQGTARDKRIAKVTAYARAQVGKWYRWGAAGPNAFDCTGLIMASYRQIGVRLSHWSGGRSGTVTGSMLAQGRRVSRAQLQPGDVVWPHPGHAVLVVSVRGSAVTIVESPRSGLRVRVVNLYRFWTARRMI